MLRCSSSLVWLVENTPISISRKQHGDGLLRQWVSYESAVLLDTEAIRGVMKSLLCLRAKYQHLLSRVEYNSTARCQVLAKTILFHK
jgi:hypothetical protein